MKVQSAARFVLAAFAALALTACSGQQQDDENLEATQGEGDDQQANLGNDDAAEGNGQENYTNNNGNQQYQQGAEVNNATEDETAATEGEVADPTLNGSAGGDVPVDTAATNPAPVNTAVAPAPAPAPAPAAGAETPVAGGRVRYVREGGVQVVNAPNGSPVLTLEQGEHPLTWEENGWLRITNGMYVPADSMSDKGVPRAHAGNGSWSH